MIRFAKILLTVTLLGLLYAHPGIGIVMNSQETVFYTDLNHVWQVDRHGNKSIAVEGVHTHELYLDSEDNLFGAHVWYEGEHTNKWGHSVWKLGADGELEEVIPATEGFISDYSFVRDASGNMYWCSDSDRTKLLKIHPDGTRTVMAEGFENIRWMRATEDGIVYIDDLLSLKKVTAEGSVMLIAKELSDGKLFRFNLQPIHSVMGIWFDESDELHVAVYSEGKIVKVGKREDRSVVYESQGMWGPTGGLFDRDGDLWVLEYSRTNKVRVREIGRGGKIETY